MTPKAIWFISVLIFALLGAVLGGYLAYKKIKHLHLVAASIIGVIVFSGIQLLFALDSPDIGMGYRLVFSLVFSILGFAYFFAFMAFRKRFRKAVGLKDKKE